MKYDFDRVIDRMGSGSAKWDYVMEGRSLVRLEEIKNQIDQKPLLAMWVADMDFPAPNEVLEALEDCARQGIFGYTSPTEAYYQTVCDWMAKRHNWATERDWIVVTPGVVPALYIIIRTFVKPGEKVLIQPPVYHPFYYAIEHNDCQVLTNPLIYENGGYRMDYIDLENKIQDPDLRMVILCSPHNPVGRVWTRAELAHFADICNQRDILVIADEIHADLILSGQSFTPYAIAAESYRENTIICTAPSKTFNLAGLKTSNILIPNKELRKALYQTIEKSALFGVNPFGIAALQAAYQHGEDWLEQVLEYIEANYRFLKNYLSEHIPQIKVIELQGTYLVWLDCRRLGLDNDALKHLMFNQAGVYLDDGFIFGSQGDGFQRMNIACPRSILAEALQRIRNVVNNRGN